MMKLNHFLVLLALAVSTTARVSYEDYKVYRLTPNTQGQVDYITSLEKVGINFWEACSVPGRSCDVLLSPTMQDGVLGHLNKLGVPFGIMINDVESLIGPEIKVQGTGRISWDQYYRVEDIHQFLRDEASNHTMIASVESMGKSFENRDLNLIKIAKTSNRKPIIFVEANVHAREWISSAVATYLIRELLNSEDPDIQSWTEDFDWYLLPVFNPDGLEYTHKTDRMWRKNRAITSSPLNCRGVDLNRNFDYNWCGVGASPNPCSETHCGTAPNSEPETMALTTYVQNLQEDLVFYLSVHSYSQFIMFSYGDRVDPNFYDSNMMVASQAAEAAEARHGTRFSPGNWLEILYASTGCSMDWAKNKLNTTLSLTYELRDTGRYGFLLPPDQILPSAEEFVDSLKPIIQALRDGSLN